MQKAFMRLENIELYASLYYLKMSPQTWPASPRLALNLCKNSIFPASQSTETIALTLPVVKTPSSTMPSAHPIPLCRLLALSFSSTMNL